MDIPEMHVWFRQYAQQMGLQNVRAILPEQIDLVINTSITDVVNQIITQNIGVTNDRIITDNSKISQINALRTLYKVANVIATPTDNPQPGTPFVKGSETTVYRITGNIDNFVKGVAKTEIAYYKISNGQLIPCDEQTQAINCSSLESAYILAASSVNNGKYVKITTTINNEGLDYLFIVDASISYYNGEKSILTNYFPIRIIDDCYLSDTLNDFILSPKLRSPIAVIYNNTFDIYVDKTIQGGLDNGLIPHLLRFSYISKPAKVRYGADLGVANVNCDLPEYLHVDILKHAVDLYRIAVSGQLHNSQQQAHPQQQAQTQQQTQ